ncbi:MAG: helix-turn-helix transcriptional regulator [Campylobacterota bacterium]|nr:helix-turn-helix transcriptional regulator [Campylobacterota bacterium]
MQQSYHEPVFLISVVSEMLDIHPQTLRQYEREGLVTPCRSNGKIRLYSQSDIDQIKTILILTREQGINLSAVDLILQLKNENQKLKDEIHMYKEKIREMNKYGIVPNSKALVIKKKLLRCGYI